MCLPPGAISARPGITRSLFCASLTSIWHRPLSRSANAAVNFSGMCWTITMPGQTRGKAVSTTSSAWVPPVEVPMATMRSVVWASACAVSRQARTASALSFGATLTDAAGSRHAPDVGMRGRLDRADEVGRGVFQKTFEADLRLGDDAHRAGGQRLHGGFRPCFGERGADHHRRRALGHDLAQETDAVHARHFHIQHDHIRPLLAHALHRKHRIGGCAHDVILPGPPPAVRSAPGAPLPNRPRSTRLFFSYPRSRS